MKGITSALQKLLRYSNAFIILTSFGQRFPVCPAFSCLNLNEVLLLLSAEKSIILPLLSRADSSL